MSSFTDVMQAYIKKMAPDVSNIIQANQSVDAPEYPYIAWRVISERNHGLPDEFSVDSGDGSNLMHTNSRTRTAEVEIQFFTSNRKNGGMIAREFCNEFLERIYLPTSVLFQAQNKVALMATRDYSNLDTVLGDKWERRAVCELTINYQYSLSEKVAYADSITTSSDYIISSEV